MLFPTCRLYVAVGTGLAIGFSYRLASIVQSPWYSIRPVLEVHIQASGCSILPESIYRVHISDSRVLSGLPSPVSEKQHPSDSQSPSMVLSLELTLHGTATIRSPQTSLQNMTSAPQSSHKGTALRLYSASSNTASVQNWSCFPNFKQMKVDIFVEIV